MASVGATESVILDMMLDLSTELIWFGCGVVIFRLFQLWFGRQGGRRQQSTRNREMCSSNAQAVPTISTPLQDWARVKASSCQLTAAEAKILGKGLAASQPDLLDEFVSFLREHPPSTPITPAIVTVWLSALASTGTPDHIGILADLVQSCLGVMMDKRGHELLLGAAAATQNPEKVDELTTKFVGMFSELTAGACVQLAWGYLSAQDVSAAARWTILCHERGAEVPSRLVLQLTRLAAALPEGVDVHLNGLMDVIPLTSDSLSVLLRRCLADEDTETAQRIERWARKFGTPFPANATEAILKLYAHAGDTSAAQLFNQAVATGFVATQGFCGSVLSRCAVSKSSELAEAVGEYLKSQGMTSLATYKTLMKAYACCGLFERACELYLHVAQSGPEPDDTMRGCVMKFAVLCGNLSLCCDILANGVPPEPSTLCTLVRVAGRDGDVAKVETLLQKLEHHHAAPVLHISVYNAAMETCLASGRFDAAAALFKRSKTSRHEDGRSYALMIKGFCAQGSVTCAVDMLAEMEAAGHSVEGACYNTLICAAVAAGDMRLAWDVFHRLERRSVALDPYAVSIMMKAARNMRSSTEAESILSLLDRKGVDMCTDSILLNTALDACIQHRDADRLSAILDMYDRSNVPVSVQTYGLLIKASNCVGDTRRCKSLWREMTQERDTVPNTLTLGCMINALVSVQLVDEAVQLFQEWKESVAINTVIYSTLMKGYVNIGDAQGAMHIFHQLKADGLQMNLVSYTTLIDSQARAGNMEMASKLFDEMRECGCEPNTITYSTLIKGHCIQGTMREALKLFDDMMSRGLRADAVVFNTMLDGCVRHDTFDLADYLLAEMPHMSVAPSNFTISIITKMWSKRGRLDRAFEAVRTLACEHRLKLDAKNGTSLISACFSNKAPQQAIEAFDEMQKWTRFPGYHGPDDGTYGTLISGLVRCGWLRKAAMYAEKACSGSMPAITGSANATSAGISSLKLLFRELAHDGLVGLGTPVIKALNAAGQRSLVISLERTCGGNAGKFRQ